MSQEPVYSVLICFIAAQRSWYTNCSLFIRGLFALVHISPGPVPSGTEAETLQVWNLPTSPRTLFAMNGFIGSALSYSKTQHLQGLNKILPRFFPFEVARLLIIYLVIVRPLEKRWVKTLFGHDLARNYALMVFVCFGSPLTSMEFSHILSTFTTDELNFPMGVADYRQMIKVVLRI